MNNKKVKQIMCSILEFKMLKAGEGYKFKFIGTDLACDYGVYSYWDYAMPFSRPVSIKASEVKND